MTCNKHKKWNLRFSEHFLYATGRVLNSLSHSLVSSLLQKEELVQHSTEQTDALSQAEDTHFILCERPVWPTGILHLKKHLWHHCSPDLDWRQARDSFTITGNTVVNREQAVPEQSFLYMLNRECKEHCLAMFIWTAKGVGALWRTLMRSKVFSEIAVKAWSFFCLLKCLGKKKKEHKNKCCVVCLVLHPCLLWNGAGPL